MTDTLADAAPEVPGEQPVPASDAIVQPEKVEVQETEPVEALKAEKEEPEENTNQEEPDPQPEQEAKEEPAPEEQAGKRKLEEDDAEEPDPKKMNTGPMEMEVRMFSFISDRLRRFAASSTVTYAQDCCFTNIHAAFTTCQDLSS